MTTRFEKVMRISSELLLFCNINGAKELHLDITEGEKSVKLFVSAALKDFPGKKLEQLRRCLSAPRQREVEQDYWELIGETGPSCEMTLCGMLCDAAVIDYDGERLTIMMTRCD